MTNPKNTINNLIQYFCKGEYKKHNICYSRRNTSKYTCEIDPVVILHTNFNEECIGLRLKSHGEIIAYRIGNIFYLRNCSYREISRNTYGKMMRKDEYEECGVDDIACILYDKKITRTFNLLCDELKKLPLKFNIDIMDQCMYFDEINFEKYIEPIMEKEKQLCKEKEAQKQKEEKEKNNMNEHPIHKVLELMFTKG